ncbi:MAG: hypothetical protein JW757_01710 [Anaerolineales bacterium]|nr:hypothetical protein [Anaerolineales bacterium]
MPQRSLPVFFVLVLLLAACAPLSPQAIPPTNTPVDPPTDSAPAPTAAPIPTTTPTPLSAEVVVLTNEPLNIVLTAVNLQLDENNLRLTEAANQIATLSAERDLLETQIAAAKTQSAAEAGNQNNTGNPGDDDYDIPSNVYTNVIIADKGYIFVVDGYNKNGAPIMNFYEPRVSFPAGLRGWAYKNAVKADGGALYYQVYDPDGQTTKEKLYYQGKQIQIKLPNGNPNPANYPPDVAKAKVLERVTVHVIVGYNDKDKPIFEPYKPYVHYEPGKELILYPKYVLGDGATYWYPIYDPDGKPSAYLPAAKVAFLYIWD